MNMLLINLLIAIILDTYKEVQKAEESGEAVTLAEGKLGKLGTKISS